jgi:hypothetical protein
MSKSGPRWAATHAAIRELQDQPATLRSDPPPTAILVPLIMVAVAWFAAAMTQDWRAQRDGTARS